MGLLMLGGVVSMSAATITAHYYGSEIDLTRKNNPCKGNVDGGVEVVVVMKVNAVKNNPDRTVVERVYSLPDGKVLKSERRVVNSPEAVVLHKLYPRNYPKVKD